MSIESIKLIAVDVDGTMTDGNYYINENGNIYKNFHTRDMVALNRADKDGYKVIFVTGATDTVIHAKVGHRYPIIAGSRDKFLDLNKYLVEQKIEWDDVAYIGDAENDFKCIMEASFSACPLDAVPEIIESSSYHSSSVGGRGAVYDIIRYLYKLRKMPWLIEPSYLKN